MHKLEKLILESYVSLLNEMDGGLLFDYFNNRGYDITERSSDGGKPGFEGYMVSKGESRSPQAVIFQHNKDTDEFTISRMSGYRIDQKDAIEAGMRQAGRSSVAGMDSYMTDGNYTPVSISTEGLKDIVDHVMTGLDREAEAQRDFYARRGPVSGTIDEDDESFDLEKEFEDNPKLTKFKDLPADMQKKFSKEIKVFGKNAPGDPNRDYVDADYETYYFTTSYNKETGSVGHRLVRLPSYSKLYNSFVKIIKDIRTLMGVDAVKNDAAAKEIFENIKTLFRQLQRYLRTNHPKQYDLMKMRRMAEGLKKAKTILEKLDYNDPVMIKSRVAKMRADDLKKLDAYKKSPEGKAAARAQASAERKEEKAREIVRKLKIKRAQVEREMENDPDIEPQGGPVADMYGDQLNKIDNAIEKAASVYNRPMDYDTAVGKVDEVKVGDILTKDGKKGKVVKVMDDMANVDFGNGDVYGITFRRIKGKEIVNEEEGHLVTFGYDLDAIQDVVDHLQSKYKEGQDFVLHIGRGDDLPNAITLKNPALEKDYDLNDMLNAAQSDQDRYDAYTDYDQRRREEDDYYEDPDYYKESKLSLAESLLDELKEEEEPEPEEEGDDEAPKDTVLEDATDQILSKFPTLKAAIIKLQTEDFKEFVDKIDWISPRPTEFRINLKNGQDYIMKWTGNGFEAQIMGKRFYINKINDYQQALDKLAILYKEGPMGGAGEGEPADTDTGGSAGGGGGDFPGDDAGGGGGGLGDDDAGGGLGDDTGGGGLGDDAGGDAGGADLTGEPVDFEEPAEDPAA